MKTTKEDFEKAIREKLRPYPYDYEKAAAACYELAKQMAIAFQVHNGMLPEVAKYHFEQWQSNSL